MCDSCRSEEDINLKKCYGYGRISAHPSDPNLMVVCLSCYDDGIYRELVVLDQLDHPNIPKPQDVEYSRGYHGPKQYIHYSLPRCVQLTDIVETLDVNVKRQIFMDIGSAVAYITSKGIYHQNISPNSIYIDLKTLTPYLLNYTYANFCFTNRASWVDPEINQEYYTTWVDPEVSKMVSGNIWSLGFLGVWMFIDQSVYDWAEERADDETIDIAYVVKGRFGFGLHRANLELVNVPESIIGIIDLLMSEVMSDLRNTSLNFFGSGDNNPIDETPIEYFANDTKGWQKVRDMSIKLYELDNGSNKPKMVLKVNPHTNDLFGK